MMTGFPALRTLLVAVMASIFSIVGIVKAADEFDLSP